MAQPPSRLSREAIIFTMEASAALMELSWMSILPNLASMLLDLPQVLAQVVDPLVPLVKPAQVLDP